MNKKKNNIELPCMFNTETLIDFSLLIRLNYILHISLNTKYMNKYPNRDSKRFFHLIVFIFINRMCIVTALSPTDKWRYNTKVSNWINTNDWIIVAYPNNIHSHQIQFICSRNRIYRLWKDIEKREHDLTRKPIYKSLIVTARSYQIKPNKVIIVLGKTRKRITFISLS